MKKEKKKKIIKIILILISIPFIVIIGLILFCLAIILWDKYTNIPKEPEIKYAEFPFEIKYEYNKEIYTLKDNIICEYKGIDYSLDGGNFRAWNCEYEESKNQGFYYIDKENNPYLYIHVPLNARYFMGEEDASDPGEPYIEFDYLKTKEEREKHKVENVDFKFLECNLTPPIKNTYK